jgi:hypothetical protein
VNWLGGVRPSDNDPISSAFLAPFDTRLIRLEVPGLRFPRSCHGKASRSDDEGEAPSAQCPPWSRISFDEYWRLESDGLAIKDISKRTSLTASGNLSYDECGQDNRRQPDQDVSHHHGLIIGRFSVEPKGDLVPAISRTVPVFWSGLIEGRLRAQLVEVEVVAPSRNQALLDFADSHHR